MYCTSSDGRLDKCFAVAVILWQYEDKFSCLFAWGARYYSQLRVSQGKEAACSLKALIFIAGPLMTL